MVHRMVRKLPPINSVKHYVQHTNLAQASGTIANQIAVDAVIAPAVANTFSVKEGSVIKAVFVERWLMADVGAGVSSQFTLTIEKKRDPEPDMTAAQSANLQAYPNKKNILYTTQGILVGASQAVPVFRQWIAIPKGKQRFGLDDQLMVNIAFVNSGRSCGMETYKEYT